MNFIDRLEYSPIPFGIKEKEFTTFANNNDPRGKDLLSEGHIRFEAKKLLVHSFGLYTALTQLAVDGIEDFYDSESLYPSVFKKNGERLFDGFNAEVYLNTPGISDGFYVSMGMDVKSSIVYSTTSVGEDLSIILPTWDTRPIDNGEETLIARVLEYSVSEHGITRDISSFTEDKRHSIIGHEPGTGEKVTVRSAKEMDFVYKTVRSMIGVVGELLEPALKLMEIDRSR